MPLYKVRVADRAKTMLGAHISFLVQANPSSASNTKGRLLAAIRSLERMPERFPFLDEDFVPRGKYRKMFVENWYLILYQVKGQYVYVDYVIDFRQDYSWLTH